MLSFAFFFQNENEIERAYNSNWKLIDRKSSNESKKKMENNNNKYYSSHVGNPKLIRIIWAKLSLYFILLRTYLFLLPFVCHSVHTHTHMPKVEQTFYKMYVHTYIQLL